MKRIILYAGKTGTTEKCAHLLSDKLGNVKVVNLEIENADISNYDIVIIGSSIRMENLHKKVDKFIMKNKDILLTKHRAFFICCGVVEDYERHFESNIDWELLKTSITYDTFGGEMNLSKQKGMDKIYLSMITKERGGCLDMGIDTEKIDEFARKINRI